MLAPAPGHQLGHAGGGGVLDQLHRQLGQRAATRSRMSMRVPAFGALLGRTPSSACQPPSDSGAAMPMPWMRCACGAAQRLEQRLQARVDLVEQRVGVGEGVVQAQALARRGR